MDGFHCFNRFVANFGQNIKSNSIDNTISDENTADREWVQTMRNFFF